MRGCGHIYKPCNKCRYKKSLWCPICKHHQNLCLFRRVE